MRRKDKEITDQAVIESIVKKEIVCRLAMCDGDMPYVIPINYGYKDGCLYLHSAQEGKKLDFISRNKNVCFEISSGHELLLFEDASECTMKYLCVIGYGRAYLINNTEEKKKALDIIMEHHTKKVPEAYPEKALNSTVIIKIEIDSMTGKKSGY